MTPAGKIQKHIKARVTETGGRYRKVRWEGRRGCPDCYVWWPGGRAAFIEVKAPGDRYSVLQEREVARMRADGLTVYTVTCDADADIVVNEILNGC